MCAGKTKVQAILTARGDTHGDYTNQTIRAQIIKNVFRQGKNWPALNFTQKETLEMIAHKLSRILEGKSDFRDHWDDIAGYAVLQANLCPKE
jgi:hypothetical protein